MVGKIGRFVAIAASMLALGGACASASAQGPAYQAHVHSDSQGVGSADLTLSIPSPAQARTAITQFARSIPSRDRIYYIVTWDGKPFARPFVCRGIWFANAKQFKASSIPSRDGQHNGPWPFISYQCKEK